MMNLLDFLGVNEQEITITKEKKKGSKKSKSTKKQEVSVQLDLFNLNQDIITKNEEELKVFKEVKNVLNTIKAPKTTVDVVVKETLDYLINKENLSTKSEDRYKDNLSAIKTLKAIKGRLANVKEQKILAKYVGWGGLSKKFENPDEDAKLQVLLGDNYNSAKASVLTSFYTPKHIINFIYKVLDRLGFEKGRILEPSCGTGRFLGFMSQEMYEQSVVTCVEIDKLSADITKNLYQSATVINAPFEDVELKDESFDLIISNIPFSSQIPYGKTDKELNEHKFKIHDYYFMKSFKKLRVGGLLVFITSSGTLDKRNEKLRDMLSTECNMLGAVRLPSNAFSDTEVTTDIIFLQKTDETVTGENWTKLTTKDDITINEYFANHPEMIIGEMKVESGQYGPVQVCKLNEPLTSDILKKYVTKFPTNTYVAPLCDDYMYEKEELLEDTFNLVEGELIISNNEVYQKQSNMLIPYKTSGIRKDKLCRFINIKECVKCIIKMQLEKCSDEELKLKQVELEELYDSYVKKYGNINDKSNSKVLSVDTRYPLVSSIELYDNQKEKYYKAQIFTTRTLGVSNEFKEIKSIEDALLVSMSNIGFLDLEDIANRIKTPKDSVIEYLLDKEMIYVNTEDTRCLEIDGEEYLKYEIEEEHISGYVKDKIKIVNENLNTLRTHYDELNDYQKKLLNYLQLSQKALEINQPEYVTDVFFEMQSSWIPLSIKEKFINKILRTHRTRLFYTKELGYTIDVKEYVSYNISQYEWGTERADAERIIIACLNMTNIEIKDTHENTDGSKYKVKNVKETQLANDKKEQWKMAFDEFINDNPDILKELLDIYNERFVNYKDRKYKNILYNLQINPLIKPREHQLEGASRIITSKHNTLLFHSVGTGKTYTMIMAAQEMSRISKLGGKRGCKNLFIIPNHLCVSGQFAKDYLTIYPQATILATTGKDFTPSNRRRLLSKIMTSNWDAVIIPYSVLGMIELKPETEIELVEQDLAEIDEAAEYYKNNSPRQSLKRLEQMRINYLDRLKELDDIKRDNSGIYWEDLGIDNIFIDEAHNFKNLHFKTRLNVPGVGGTTAKKTRDLYNKIRYHRKIHGEKGIVFATATPISNSMSEIYLVMKYLCEGILHRYGFGCFDEWASSYGKVVTNMEVNPTGKGFRFKDSFSKFNNVPELMQLFRHVADIVNIKDIEDIKLPNVYNGSPVNIEVDPTKEMLDYIDELVERAERISKKEVEPNEDNMLMVVNDGKKMAVSPYLVGISGDSPKINAAVDKLSELYLREEGTTHMVFCDLGTPKKNNSISKKKNNEVACDIDLEDENNNNKEEEVISLSDILESFSKQKINHDVYVEIKDKLIDKGVKAEDIVFIHDYEKPEKRKKMLEDFNAARIRILIGSTSKMGEGLRI